MIRGVFSSARFFWLATQGNRLRPWRSEYLRWRMETYSGQKASSITMRDCTRLLWAERRQMLRFFGWLGSMRTLAQGGRID